MPNYGAFRFTRIGGPDAGCGRRLLAGEERLGPVQASSKRPNIRRSRSGTGCRSRPGQAYAEAAVYGEQIRSELAAKDPNLLVLDREFETQSVDPIFLEPESALGGWYDPPQDSRTRRWRAVRPTRRRVCRVPARRRSGRLEADAHQHELRLCGGGFGGRDLHRFRSMGPWPRFSFQIVQFVWPTIASISFNPDSSGTPSRCRPG